MAIYQVVCKARSPLPTEFRNVHHYDSGAVVLDTAQQQLLANTIDDDYKSNLQAVLSTSIEFYAYDIRRVDIASLPAIEYVPGAGVWTGSAVGDKLPEQIAALLTMKAQTTFPRTTRTYLFGFVESENGSSGSIASNLLSAINLWAADVQTLTITGPITLAKVAVKYTGSPPAVTAFNEVFPSPAGSSWATQRRRRRGVGI